MKTIFIIKFITPRIKHETLRILCTLFFSLFSLLGMTFCDDITPDSIKGDEQSNCPQLFDSTICDEFVDAFPNNDCANTDTDDDGTPDELLEGCTSSFLTPLIEDAFPIDECASIDSDGDGYPNALHCSDGVKTNLKRDAFPDDVCANRDTDGDTFPDEILCPEGVSSRLQEDKEDDGDGIFDTIDKFPKDNCASVDDDNDGYPAARHCKKGFTTNLEVDDDDEVPKSP